jgi:hypothetical protein
MAFDFIGAISGNDISMSFALVLMIIYFLWFFNWGKKQLGTTFGLLLAMILFYLTFFLYPDLVWVPFVLFLFATFGKDLLEIVNK